MSIGNEIKNEIADAYDAEIVALRRQLAEALAENERLREICREGVTKAERNGMGDWPVFRKLRAALAQTKETSHD